MFRTKISVFQKVFWSLLVCAMLAGPVFAAISDSDFVELCMEGSLQQITDAIDNGANVNAKIDGGATPLICAAAVNRNPEAIKALINAGADVNARDATGFSPLILAAGNNNLSLEAITALINAGADVNAKTLEGRTAESGFTPLMVASSQRFNPDVIKALINSGADVNAKNRAGWTPLILAAGNNDPNPEVITALINAGADVNARVRDDRSTPLILAAENCSNPEVIRILLDSGANPIAKKIIAQSRGEDKIFTAIDYARENINLKDTEIIKKLEEKTVSALLVRERELEFIKLCIRGSLEQIELAIVNGANVNARTEEDERTPLMLAMMDTRFAPELIEALINAGADVHLRDETGGTPLMYAAGNNPNTEMITVLVKAGADVNVNDDNGYTPLILAAYNNTNPEMITILLELGADPKMKNRYGMTAIEYAKGNKNLTDTDALRKLEEMSR
jgi:ankyrin repeat protein